MRKSGKVHNWLRAATGMLMLFAVMTVGLAWFSITSYADSAGKVTATGARIRKEPSASSEALASVEQDAVLNIKAQTTGSDGYTWYQVEDSNTTGYIRSDLVAITDGSTPATLVSPTTVPTSPTPTTSTPEQAQENVTAVEPVSGTVSGGTPVRVRQKASADSSISRIVSTVQSGQALTVTGTVTGTDGKEWYQVSFSSGSSEVTGFIRADYVSLSGELVEPGMGGETPGDGQQAETTDPEPEKPKDWDTYSEGGKWHLLDNTSGNTYDIDQIFESVEANKKILTDTIKSNKTQQVIVVILCIILVVMAAVISFLIFKLKDMTDAEYFNEVERETARRRTADRPVQRSQRPMQGGGPEGRRPAGQRPSGAGGSGQRPAGQRPMSAGEDRQRPAGGSGQRPVKRQPEYEQDYTPEREPAYGQDVAPEAPVREKAPAQSNGKSLRKSRNFADDDDIEFQFLDWDGDDKN